MLFTGKYWKRFLRSMAIYRRLTINCRTKRLNRVSEKVLIDQKSITGKTWTLQNKISAQLGCRTFIAEIILMIFFLFTFQAFLIRHHAV
jgi:hypothetical protein